MIDPSHQHKALESLRTVQQEDFETLLTLPRGWPPLPRRSNASPETGPAAPPSPSGACTPWQTAPGAGNEKAGRREGSNIIIV